MADIASEHPAARVVSDLGALLDHAASPGPSGPDKTYVRLLRDELREASSKAAEARISEREYLAQRIVKLEADASVILKNIRLDGWRARFA